MLPDLDTACRKAFEIAAEAGRPGWRSAGTRPVRVSVYHDDEFELSIEIAQNRRLAAGQAAT